MKIKDRLRQFLSNKSVTTKVSLLIVLLGLFTFIVGTSYAILNGEVSANNEQVIKAGNVEVLLTEYFDNIDKKISIMSDEDGLLQEEVYNFNIKNIGEVAGKYKIVLNNEEPSDYTGDVLSSEYIKIGLEVNDEEYGPFTLEEANNILDSGIIYKKELIDYNLRIWLDESASEELAAMEDYKAFLSLDVTIEQKSDSSDEGITKTFSYTGDYQTYKVPRDGYYFIEMAGAQGGSVSTTYYGGMGAKTSGYIELSAGDKLYFYVGEAGKTGTAAVVATYPGGYNGGGQGYVSRASCSQTAASGGGATDVRLVSGNWDNNDSLISRIMVAGGGGGSFTENCSTSDNANVYGGDGGALVGGKPVYKSYTGFSAYNPKGGSQTDGGQGLDAWTATAYVNSYTGTFGKGGTGGNSYSGGGGGYYGGASGVWQPGAGGSSYISGYAGVDSVEDNSTITHTGQTYHYSGKNFVGGQMIEGANSGDGYAKITYIDEITHRNSQLNNVRYIKNCMRGNSINTDNHWIELQAIKEGINIAKGKTAVVKNFAETTNYSEISSSPYSRITDGNITYSLYGYPNSGAGTNQCVIVDLGSEETLDEVAVWNYFGDQRSYYDNVTYVAGENKNYREVINDASVESSNGHRISAYSDTLNGYVQDNLILWYDGYANNGSVRNHTTTTWKDLSGSGYNGTVTGATWWNNYLYFDGTNDYVKTNSALNYNSSKSFTLQFVASISQTALGIIFESSANSNSNNGSYYIDTNEHGTKDLTLAMKYGSLTNHKYVDNLLTSNVSHYTLVFDSTRSYNDYILIYKDGVNVGAIPWSESSANSNLADKILSNYVFYIASRAGTKYYTKMNLNSLRIYNKALTEDEITHNYLYDKQIFNLE